MDVFPPRLLGSHPEPTRVDVRDRDTRRDLEAVPEQGRQTKGCVPIDFRAVRARENPIDLHCRVVAIDDWNSHRRVVLLVGDAERVRKSEAENFDRRLERQPADATVALQLGAVTHSVALEETEAEFPDLRD